MIFGSHLPAYTSCLVAATGAAALVGADGVSIAEYQGKKQTNKINSPHSTLSGGSRGGSWGEQDPPPPPPHLSVKDSIQCKKETWVYVFFSSSTTWVTLSLKVFLCLLLLVTWESGLDKVSTEIHGLSSTDYNFQGLSRCVRTPVWTRF